MGAGLGAYLPASMGGSDGSSGCTLCQNPMAQQFLFFTAIIAALWFWYVVVED